MKTTIDTRFATAKDTAHVLGVGRSRLKKLVRLATSTDGRESVPHTVTYAQRKRNGAWSEHVYRKTSNSKHRTTGKSRVSSRRRARGKLAKSAR